jgi:hypothetical protein
MITDNWTQEEIDWYLTHKPKYVPKKKEIKPKQLKINKIVKHDSSWPRKYISYLKRAKSKSLSFELSVEHFTDIISQDCKYCGKHNAGGIDRIDPKLGYTTSNCAPCCIQCNTMKFTYSTEDFLSHVQKIYNNNL